MIGEIGAVIKQLAAKGDMAILLVEQFYDFAADLADSYLVMSRGSIVQRRRQQYGTGRCTRAGGDLNEAKGAACLKVVQLFLLADVMD